MYSHGGFKEKWSIEETDKDEELRWQVVATVLEDSQWRKLWRHDIDWQRDSLSNEL